MSIIAFLLSLVFFPFRSSKRVVFFGPTPFKYSDNVRYAFECLNAHSNLDLDIVWITRSEDVEKFISHKGYRVIRQNTFSALFYFFSSGFLVSGETSIPLFKRLRSFFATYICLNHGFGPRSVVAFDGKIYNSNQAVRQAVNKYDYIFYPSHYMAITVGSLQFDVPISKMVFADQFRTFYQKTQVRTNDLTQVLYSPTWRSSVKWSLNDLFSFFDVTSLRDLNNLLISHRVFLTITLHPLMDIESVSDSNYSIINGSDPLVCASELVAACDIFISDYSSLISDAVSLDKCVYLYCPDYEYFQFEYGLNTYLTHDFPFNFVQEFSEVLSNYSEGYEFDNISYKEKYCSISADPFPELLKIIEGDI